MPDRTGLLPLERYATLERPDGTRGTAGYTEASRGCRHLCRHCPIVPVYDGQFRVVQPEVVLADVAGQVAAGARHITFGDPDFFNGPTHAMRIVHALHDAHPGVSYDVTIKVEHLLQHRDLLPALAATGCAFVTSAVESVDDDVLERLAKGTHAPGFRRGRRPVSRRRVDADADVRRVPPVDDARALLRSRRDPGRARPHRSRRADPARDPAPHSQGSRLLDLEEVRALAGPFDAATLTYRWVHRDPRVDALQRAISNLVGVRLTGDRRALFEEIAAMAHDAAGRPRPSARPARDRATVPYLNEPWYC